MLTSCCGDNKKKKKLPNELKNFEEPVYVYKLNDVEVGVEPETQISFYINGKIYSGKLIFKKM